MKVNLHYRRPQRDVLASSSPSTPINLDITQTQQGIPRRRAPTQIIPISTFKITQLNGLEFYGFDGTIEEGGDYIIANMHIPNFLKQSDSDSTGLNGAFLISLGDGFPNILDSNCKAVGRQGCPSRILMGATKSFYFNGMNFYPFMMRDFSIGYYVCDADSLEYDWQKKHDTNFDKMFMVALNQQVTFDATLGIYQTRDADLL